MSEHSPTKQLDLTNAPFSEEQREWLQQLAQWAKPPPTRGENQQQGESSSASGASQSDSGAKQAPGESIESVRMARIVYVHEKRGQRSCNACETGPAASAAVHVHEKRGQRPQQPCISTRNGASGLIRRPVTMHVQERQGQWPHTVASSHAWT